MQPLLASAGLDHFGTEANLTMRLCEEQGFRVFSEIGKAYWHCATLKQRPTGASLAELSEFARRMRTVDAKTNLPIWLVALIEGYGAIGDTEAGLATIADAFTLIEVTSEREREAELYRLKGELLQKREQTDAAARSPAEMSLKNRLRELLGK